jgi:hypothetical protein
VLGFDTAPAFTTQVGLKLIAIFPQIMQQPGKRGFGSEVERRGELPCQFGDFGQVRVERLPLARVLWQWFPIFIFRRVCVIIHPIGPELLGGGTFRNRNPRN